MSDSDIIHREEEIFDLARRIESPDVRASYLRQACDGDSEMESRINELLEIHLNGDSLLDQPPVEIGPTLLSSSSELEREGQAIGPYQLLQKLGEGGFGVVYMAEQTKPVRRKVAFKIIKPGMESEDVVARFEAERQTLAMMNHPNIASVLDGGCTPSGRPYFVMELVRGVSITEYCDKKQLSSTERLKLFMDVCSAIQHAHQKAVIHRDLKPSNVMVTLHDGRPVVKVIDFGIAKALNQQLTEKLYFTRYGQMIGTPQYMSPEQAEMSGLGIDTLSDIYSLGVLLYELLVGVTPLSEEDLKEAGYKEMQRLICEEEPSRPSNRLSTTDKEQQIDIAAHRGVTPQQLADDVSGDLEWIVMKTLEKDRERRYPTPIELANDLQRFLNDEPVQARPPTFRYRASKYIRRHRGAVTSVAAIGLVLIGTSLFSSYMWGIASREREKTNDALAKVEGVNHKLETQLYRVRLDDASELMKKGSRVEAEKVLAHCPERSKDWVFKRLDYALKSTRGALSGAQVPMFLDQPDHLMCISNKGGTGKLITWNAKTGERMYDRILTSFDTLSMSAMSSDKKLVAVGTYDGHLFLVDVSDSSQVRKLEKIHAGRIDGLGFSPDGSTLASSGFDGWLRLWDVATGKLVHEQDTGEPLRCAEFDPRGRYVATAASGTSKGAKKVRIWDAKTLDIVRELTIDDGRMLSVCFSSDGGLLAIGGSGGVEILNTNTWKAESRYSALPGGAHCIRFGDDGKTLAIAGKSFIEFRRLSDQQLIERIHTGSKTAYWGNFSPSGEAFAYYLGDNELRIHDLSHQGSRDQNQVVSLHGAMGNFAAGRFNADGSLFAAAGAHRSIKVWDTASLQPVRDLHGHQSVILELEWSRNGKLFSRDVGGGLKSWDANGESLWEQTEEVVLTDLDPGDLMAIDPTRLRLYLGTHHHGIRILDTETGKRAAPPIGVSGPVQSLECSPDGQWLAWSDSPDGVIRLKNLRTGTLQDPIETKAGIIRKIIFSPDSQRLSAISAHDAMEFDIASRQRRWTLRSKVQLWGLAYSSSGRRLFVSPGTKDPHLKVIDTSDGTLIHEISKPGCHNVAFDTDRETLACFGYGAVQFHETRATSPKQRATQPALSPKDAFEPTPFEQISESRNILFKRKADEYPRALELANAAAETVPNCAEYELTRGIALFRQNEIDESIKALQKVDSMKWNVMNHGPIQQETLKVHSLAIRAMAFHGKDESERALDHLRRAEQLAVRVRADTVENILAEAKEALAIERDVE